MTTHHSVKEAAAYLRLSPQTLNNWRVKGCGPAFNKFGRRVVYDEADLLAWKAETRRNNTQQKTSP